jgi:hypothetical protein
MVEEEKTPAQPLISQEEEVGAMGQVIEMAVSLKNIISGPRDTWIMDARVCKSTYEVFFIRSLVHQASYAVKVFPHYIKGSFQDFKDEV